MAIITPATRDITAYKGTTNVNPDIVISYSIVMNLTGATVDFTLSPQKSSSEKLRLSSASGANANGSQCEILTTGSTSTFSITVSDADIQDLAAGNYRYGVWITDSLEVTNLYVRGAFNLKNL